jgi:hypothetical protein
MRTETRLSAETSARDSGSASAALRGRGDDEYRVGYDEYRVKMYKVACRAAREQREQLRLDWEQRNRERD